MNKTGLDDFREFVGDFHSVWGLAAKGAVALPLVDLVAKVGPPWPPGLAYATALAQLLVLMLVFQSWHRLSQTRMRRRVIGAASVLAASFFAYLLLLHGTVVGEIPGGGRVVAGFIIRPDVEPLLGPLFSAREALASAEYDPREVWTAGSIAAARIALVAAWLVLFSSLTTMMGAFVLNERRRRVRR